MLFAFRSQWRKAYSSLFRIHHEYPVLGNTFALKRCRVEVLATWVMVFYLSKIYFINNKWFCWPSVKQCVQLLLVLLFSPQPFFSLLFSTNERPDLSSCWADYVVNRRGRSSTDPLVSDLHPFVLAPEMEQNRKVFLQHAINHKQVNPSLQFFNCIKSSGCTVGERHKRICQSAKTCVFLTHYKIHFESELKKEKNV